MDESALFFNPNTSLVESKKAGTGIRIKDGVNQSLLRVLFLEDIVEKMSVWRIQ